MWTFWIAATVFPTVTFFVYLHDSPDTREWVYLAIINFVIFGYLCSKLEDYENFLKYHRSLKGNGGDGNIDTSEKIYMSNGIEPDKNKVQDGLLRDQIVQESLSKMNNKNIKSFSFLAMAAGGGIAFYLYRLYNLFKLSGGLQDVFQTGLNDIYTILFMATFLVFYYKKSIWSWWMIPLMGPLGWALHYLQHPFEWWPFLMMFIAWILICYFFVIRKYEDYKAFLKENK